MLGPLSREHLIAVVRAAVGAVPQPVLDRVCQLSDGNPLFAIELARSRHAGDGLRAAMPATLRATLASRMGAVTADRLTVLRTAAALGPATLVALSTACEHPSAGSLIADALARSCSICGEDGLVRFAHPLLASVILDGTNPVERMALHARLGGRRHRPGQSSPPPGPVVQWARCFRRRGAGGRRRTSGAVGGDRRRSRAGHAQHSGDAGLRSETRVPVAR